MRTADVVIIGAGFAGLATGAALVEAGVRKVLVLDRESRSCAHASGQNAGLVRRAVEDSAIAKLAREGADALARLPRVFRATGSLLFGAAGRIPSEVIEASGARALASRETRKLAPLLIGARLGGALHTPGDGVVDIDDLTRHYISIIERGGGEILLAVEATGVDIQHGRVVAVETSDERLDCAHVVIAAGAWAGRLAAKAGAPIQLTSRRRHILLTGRPEGDTAEMPWVWDLKHRFYTRPAAEGMLWSACDNKPGDPDLLRADEAELARIEAIAAARIPACRGMKPWRGWAGYRTFTPDERFLLGPDPRIAGWHWAAALGGHGVTVSAAIGRRVAAGILNGAGAIEPEFLWREERGGARPAGDFATDAASAAAADAANDAASRAPAAPADQNLAQLLRTEVPLTVMLGSVEIPLETLLQFNEGATFVLPDASSQRLRLCAGDVVLGEGVAVRVGDKLAIQLSWVRNAREILAALPLKGARDP